MTNGSRRIAADMKATFETLSPFIEKHTASVCPTCRNVCCIDRHGTYEKEDIAFLEALGEAYPLNPPKADDTEPCRHLGATGCRLPRWQRPFRCTWYFCTPLLESMPEDKPREYRKFLKMFQRLQELRLHIIR